MNISTTTFSHKLRQLRKNKNLSQKEVSEHTGITESTYSRLEQGKSIPHTDTLKILAEFYDVPVSDLADDKVTFNITDNKGLQNSGITYYYTNEDLIEKLEKENTILRNENNRLIGVIEKLATKA